MATELPEFLVSTGFTGTSGASTFETRGGTSIACTKSTIEGTATTSKSGSFHLLERECVSTSLKCTTSGETAGTISISGEWHLVPGEGTTFLLAPEEFQFKCGGIISVKIKGSIPSLISPIESKAKEFELETQESEGSQEVTEYENDGEEAIQTGLLVSFNGGAFEEAAEKVSEAKISTSNETQIVGPSFSVTNPLGRRKIKVGKAVDLVVKNRTLLLRSLNSLTFGQSSKEEPFSVNSTNLTKCKGLSYEKLLACSVEVKYNAKVANSTATLSLRDSNNRLARATVVGE